MTPPNPNAGILAEVLVTVAVVLAGGFIVFLVGAFILSSVTGGRP